MSIYGTPLKNCPHPTPPFASQHPVSSSLKKIPAPARNAENDGAHGGFATPLHGPPNRPTNSSRAVYVIKAVYSNARNKTKTSSTSTGGGGVVRGTWEAILSNQTTTKKAQREGGGSNSPPRKSKLQKRPSRKDAAVQPGPAIQRDLIREQNPVTPNTKMRGAKGVTYTGYSSPTSGVKMCPLSHTRLSSFRFSRLSTHTGGRGENNQKQKKQGI